MNPQVQAFLDNDSETFSYVVYDCDGGHAAVIDPVLDFDSKSGRTHTESAEKVVNFIRQHELTLDWILETHAHADHLSAAPYIREQLGGQIAIGEKIQDVQKIFSTLFNFEKTFLNDGSQFDHLFADGDTFSIGGLTGKVLSSPGHTPADLAYLIGDALFVGDTLFMPDVGTARCDFPGGDAATLYQSVKKLLALPNETRVFVCHDYPGDRREHKYETSVAAQREHNIHVHDGVGEQEFVAMREARDATLDMPRLILPSVQVNVRGGQMPPAEDNGTVYLKLPINVL
ncbi:MAG: MBL fold metallo-hydrolase [Alcanivoracaceae bacterium]|nr:MBL fold metallo-hydrolase [Alcanivoracaceae bacterium]